MFPTLVFAAAFAVAADKPAPPAKFIAAKAEFEKGSDTARKALADDIAKLVENYKKQLVAIQVEETKAGNLDGAVLVRDEVKRIETGLAVSGKVETAADLAKVLSETVWKWEKSTIYLREGKAAYHQNLGNFTWKAIDRRTVLLLCTIQNKERVAVLHFSEWIDSFEGYDFDSKVIEPKSRVVQEK